MSLRRQSKENIIQLQKQVNIIVILPKEIVKTTRLVSSAWYEVINSGYSLRAALIAQVPDRINFSLYLLRENCLWAATRWRKLHYFSGCNCSSCKNHNTCYNASAFICCVHGLQFNYAWGILWNKDVNCQSW